MEIKEISPAADKGLAAIIRWNFEKHSLNIPGTAYFDPELDCLSRFFLAKPDKRAYFVLWDQDTVCGGIGIAQFEAFDSCAEIQKFYLSDSVKGRGYGKQLLLLAEKKAREMGYRKAYIETHTNFTLALEMYGRYGYRLIEKPGSVSHGTMNRFLIKDL